MLSKTGSVCGKPLYCDKCTLSKLRVGYARIMVQMDSSGEFPEMIDILDENGVGFQQKVVYEWRQSVCSSCKKFGRLRLDCRVGRLDKMPWKVKNKSIQELCKVGKEVSFNVISKSKLCGIEMASNVVSGVPPEEANLGV